LHLNIEIFQVAEKKGLPTFGKSLQMVLMGRFCIFFITKPEFTICKRVWRQTGINIQNLFVAKRNKTFMIREVSLRSEERFAGVKFLLFEFLFLHCFQRHLICHD